MKRLLYSVPALSLLPAAVLLYEWFRIGLLKDPKVIESYHFGSEAMIGAGGLSYASAEAYSKSCLIHGSIILLAAIVTFLGLRRKIRPLWIGGYIIFVLYIAWGVWNFLSPPNI